MDYSPRIRSAEHLADAIRNISRVVYDTELLLYRPQDLLFLKMKFVNFEIRDDHKLHRKSQNTAFVVICFQPQSIAETAYPENESVPKFPAEAFAASDSRLVYEIPNSIIEIPLTAEGLLGFSNWKLRVNERAAAHIITGFNREILIPDINKPLRTNPIPDPLEKLAGFQSISASIRILQTLLISTTPKSRKAAINFANRIADKHEQLQLAVSRLPKEELNRLERIRNVGDLNDLVNEVGLKAPGPLHELETSIEMPWRLYLSPSNIHTFAHDHKLKLFDVFKVNKAPMQVYELWHSRLAISNEQGEPNETDADKKLLTMRALWGADVSDKPGVIETDLPSTPFSDQASEAMNSKQRHAIVHESSNWSITNYIPKPVRINNMMLSTLGAWLDSEFTVPLEDLENGILGREHNYDTPMLNKGLNCLLWKHISTMARDHYVEIVEAGNIFPFGHTATYVTITERKPDPKNGYALNRKREFIIITEPEKSFSARGNGGSDEFLAFPFRKIKIHTTVTPPIENPKQYCDEVLGKQFVIKVGGKEFPFKISAIDSEGNEIHFELPLVFVSTDVSGASNIKKIEQIISKYGTIEKPSTAPGITTRAPLNGQSVALADSFVPGDTSFEAEQIEFACRFIPESDEFHCFYPTVASVKIFEPSSQALTGQHLASSIELVDDKDDKEIINKGKVYAKFKDSGGIPVRFDGNTDKTGGSLAPNFSMTGLSKLQGAFGGDIDKMKSLYTDFSKAELDKTLEFTKDALAFFGEGGVNGLLPKLFGYVDLRKIVRIAPVDKAVEKLLRKAETLTGEIEELKNQIAEKQQQIKEQTEEVKNNVTGAVNRLDELRSSLDEINSQIIEKVKNFEIPIPGLKRIKLPTTECFQYNWYPDVKSLEEDILIDGILKLNFTEMPQLPPFETTETDPDKKNEEQEKWNEKNIKNRNIYVTTLIKRHIVPEFTAEAGIKNFSVKLIGIINIKFKEVLFKVDKDTKTDFNVELEDDAIEFFGPLKFIETIKDIIPFNGFSDPPELDVTKEGIKTGYTLAVPDLNIGCFLLGNLSLTAMINLPFTGAPMTMRFNVSEREKPFVLTVSFLGGCGYFGMEFDLKGLRMLEASLEFGAALSMDIGVASGEVCVMGGIYFKMKWEDGNSATELTGFLRINGSMSVLSLITVTVEFYLGLEYHKDTNKAWGEATLKVNIDMFFFSVSVDLHVRREFSGSGNDPTFRMLMPESDWYEYCDGFAA